MKVAASPAVFNPDAIASINRAYAQATEILGEAAAPTEVRAKLAEHVMTLARNGETNEARLCKLSVSAVLGRDPALVLVRQSDGHRGES